jgi:hypothetical protein
MRGGSNPGRSGYFLQWLEDPMPRYYFDLWEGTEFAEDEEGLFFLSLDAATREAVRALGEIVAEDLTADLRSKDLSIRIRNNTGRVLVDVAIRFAMQQID